MAQFSRFKRRTRLTALVLTFVSLSVAAENNSDGLTILKSRCFGCHNGKTAQSKLDLTSRESALRGGERGPAIVAGKATDSLVYQFASQQVRPFMPPAGERLSPEELKTVAAWIDAGASWPAGSTESVFTSAIKPLLEQKCVGCHHPGAGKASGLDLTSREKLLEGGDHGPVVALDNPESSALVGRLRHTGSADADWTARHLPRAKPAPQRLIEVTHAVTIKSPEFRFAADYRGLEVIPKKGSVLGHDGSDPVKTPYDDCVLIMPSRRLQPGQTAVRLGRYVEQRS